MAYHETKVYFDGSHYIAIPHTETPRKPRKYKPPPVDPATIKRPTEEPLDVASLFEECDPEERVFDTRSKLPFEEKSKPTPVSEVPETEKQPTEKDVFNRLYEENINAPRHERRRLVLEKMKPYFENDREAELFVDANMVRKQTNLIARRIRMIRKVNLQEFNYFVTFTYSDAIHTEESFRKKLRNTLSHLCSRKGWRYVGVWERSPEKKRLHFHGIFYVPNGTMPGEMKEVKSYSFSEHRPQITMQNSYFEKQFGRNDFRPIERKERLGSAVAYLLKYIEKSGEKIVYSRGLPQFFISNILEDDVVCRIGLEDKKLLLFDNFSCFDEGCYVGPVSSETIKQLRKSN